MLLPIKAAVMCHVITTKLATLKLLTVANNDGNHFWKECKKVQIFWKTTWYFLINLETCIPYKASNSSLAHKYKVNSITTFTAELWELAKPWSTHVPSDRRKRTSMMDCYLHWIESECTAATRTSGNLRYRIIAKNKSQITKSSYHFVILKNETKYHLA